MARKKIHVSQYTIDKLNQFDYGDLYSVHHGVNHAYWHECDVEIFVGVNRYCRLYIIATISGSDCSATFDFDELDKAVGWVKRRICPEPPKEGA